MCCRTFGMICLLLFGFFNSIRSPRYTDETMGRSYVHFYILASDPSQCLEVRTAHPMSPRFLFVFTDFHLRYAEKPDQVMHHYSERYYLKTLTQCSSNFEISNIYTNFQYIDLKIYLYTTYYYENELAGFDYVVKRDLHYGVHELSDKYSNFEIKVQFVRYGKQYIPPSSNDYEKAVEILKTNDDAGTHICVIGHNSIGFTFEPTFTDGAKPIGIITDLLYKYLSDAGMSKQREYKAWDCSGATFYENDGDFVKDQYGHSLLEASLRSFDFKTQKYVETEIVIPEKKIVKFEDSQKFSGARLIYLMNNKSEIHICPKGDTVHTYKTALQKVYWAEKMEKTTKNGLEWTEWRPVSPNDLCPKAKS